MLPEILEITNGTDTVSLLSEKAGFILDRWEPKLAQPKGGGVFKDSSVAHGRQLALKYYQNVEEEFTLKLVGADQAAVYRHGRKLRKLLEQADAYWTSGFNYTPVYLRVKGEGEAYPRYCPIAGWAIEAESDPFSPPLGGPVLTAAMDDFDLLIERKPFWKDQVPGSDDAIEAGVTQTYDGRTLGNVDDTGTLDPTTAAEVFFANSSTIAQLTDIYENDGGVWSANLLDAVLPHRILPVGPAINDAIYFGIDTGVADSGPFSSLIFDLLAATTGVTGQWEYWNGAAFAVFPAPAGFNHLADNTQGFTVTGVEGVFWDHPALWTTCNLLAVLGGAAPNITGWWVRFRVTAAAAATGASQQNRDIYTVTWPYVEIQNDQIESELSALTRMQIRNESNFDDDTDTKKFTNRLICGARGVDRGSNFNAYIPLADVQLLSGQTINLGTAAYASDIFNSARLRYISIAPAGSIVTVTLDNTIANDYKGRFHIYLRHTVSGDYTVQISCRAYGDVWHSDVIGLPNNLNVKITDFGSVTLPPSGAENNETVDEIEFEINVLDLGGSATAGIYDLILIPADEWIGSFFADDIHGPNLDGTNYLDADSVTFPKKPLYSPILNRSSGNLESQYTNTTVGPISLEAERQMRLWFLGLGNEISGLLIPEWNAKHSYAHTIQMSIARQYLAAIGSAL